MKKTKYPDPDQVKTLIDDAKRIRRLAEERETLNEQLSGTSTVLRRALEDVMMEAHDPNKGLDSLLNEYRRLKINDGEIADLLKTKEELRSKLTGKIEELSALRAAIAPLAKAICSRVESLKLAEYESLISEISEKLAPYCGGNTEDARSLAVETAAVRGLYTQACECRQVTYAPGNFLPPLVAALNAITS